MAQWHDPNAKQPIDVGAMELYGSLAPLGAEEEEIAKLRKDEARYRDIAYPGMYGNSRIMIRANPLEHAAWGVNQWNAHLAAQEAQKRRRQLGTDTQQKVATWAELLRNRAQSGTAGRTPPISADVTKPVTTPEDNQE